MERAREHIRTATTTTTTSSPLQKNGVDREDESETVGGEDSGFASVGGEEGGGDGDRSKLEGGVVGAGMGSERVADGIRSLIRATWEDVKDWCDEEAEARVRRKDAQVSHTHLFFSVAPRDTLVSHECHLVCISDAWTSVFESV